jgi:hypothetical protein
MCKYTVQLKPRAKHIVCGEVVSENLRSSPTLACVEAALIPIQGICMPRVLTYTSADSSETQKEASVSDKSRGFETHSCSESEPESNIAEGSSPELKQSCDTVVLMVANFSDE